MKLGETKEFWTVRKTGTEIFYDAISAALSDAGATDTTDDILRAQLFTGRDEAEQFQKQVAQAEIVANQKLPPLEIVRIRITTEQLNPF